MGHGSAHGRPGRTARLMLLLATLLGLAAMHTLGHHGPHLTLGHPGSHLAAMAEDAPAGLVTMGDAVQAAPMRDGDGMGGWDVCLAVLVAFAVLLLAAVLLRTRRSAATANPAGRSSATRPRGPPRRWVGLTLAKVSVLRT